MTVSKKARFSFLFKVVGATALIGLADWFFYGEEPGWTLGGFALAWVAVVALCRPNVRRDKAACVKLAAAAAFALILVDDPGPLAWCLFWVSIASAALLPTQRFDDAMRWGAHLLRHGLFGLAVPFKDAGRLSHLRGYESRTRLSAFAMILILPVVGGGIFLALFAEANPLIGNALTAIRLPDLSSVALHVVLWLMVLLAVWPNLRPRGTIRQFRSEATDDRAWLPDIPVATLVLSLVTFNALFAVENALDLAFLWSGAALPAGVTLADYAHRGAYPLIATALLAALFVLVVSRPGSAAASSRTVRRLIVVWVAQNLLLVASSILRTVNYIAAYSLTELRIAALAWMALVAAGLIFIVCRMLTGRTAAWLINTNAFAAGIVLTAASVVDLGSIAATWNVRHARHAEDLDLCYLRHLGPSALLPLIELEKRAGGPLLRETAASIREGALGRLRREQGDWHSWTWRGARRLHDATMLLGPNPYRPATPRRCDGSIAEPTDD